MSTDRDVASLLRSWMRSDPDGPADHVLAAALAEIDTTPQRRATWWPARRSLDMNFIVKFGVAAAALAMAVVLGYGLWQNIGNQQPAPDPEASADPGPGSELPPELQRLFIGAERTVQEVSDQPFVAIDLTASVFRAGQAFGVSELASAASVTSAGQVRFETVAENTGCAVGDVGIYPYSLSAEGTRLVFAPGSDDCPERAAVVSGLWQLMDCRASDNWCLGPLEPDLSQSSLFFDPFRSDFGEAVTRYGAMEYVVPPGWANADDRTHFYTLLRADAYTEGVPFDCLDCPDGVWIGAYPRASQSGCTGGIDEDIGASAAALAEWIRTHPGLDVIDERATTVDGRPTIVLDIGGSESWADACVDPEHQVTHVPLFSHLGYDYGIRTGDRQRLLLVEVDADTAMLIGIDSFDPADLPALIEETQPIIESIRLTPP